MSQPGAGVRREREAIRARRALQCPPHPEELIAHHDGERAGSRPKRICTQCFTHLPCQACGRELVTDPGDACPLLERCEARRPW